MGKEDLPAWQASAQYALATAMLLKSRIDTALSQTVGHSLADNEALANLRDAGRPMRMGEIAARLTLSPGGVTRLVDRLEDSGYVTRHPDLEDRRATTVEITDEGRSAAELARPVIVDTIWEAWGRHLGDEEASALLAALRQVTAGNDGFG
jgi:DNA-binding MarR family transcriptional regulator